MARKFIKKSSKDLENIVKDCVKRVGFKAKKEQSFLLLRLIMSGIANYFFKQPDNLVDVGFLRFRKSPVKEEMFTVEIIKDAQEGVVNAETLYKYYKGELATEGALKSLLDGFINELVSYAQIQEMNATSVTSKVSRRTSRVSRKSE